MRVKAEGGGGGIEPSNSSQLKLRRVDSSVVMNRNWLVSVNWFDSSRCWFAVESVTFGASVSTRFYWGKVFFAFFSFSSLSRCAYIVSLDERFNPVRYHTSVLPERSNPSKAGCEQFRVTNFWLNVFTVLPLHTKAQGNYPMSIRIQACLMCIILVDCLFTCTSFLTPLC